MGNIKNFGHGWLKFQRKHTMFNSKSTVCYREGRLSNMGITALLSRMEGELHKRRMKLAEQSKSRPTSIANFLITSGSSVSVNRPTSTSVCDGFSSTVDSMHIFQ